MKGTPTRNETLRLEIVRILPRLRRFARSLARDPDKADDIVQAACERALLRLDQVREGTRLDSWLYRIIYTRWIDKVRRRKTRSANLVVLNNESSQDAVDSETGDCLATALDIKAALEALPAENRIAITLVSVEGYSYEETALILDLPVGTVASRVARARRVLASILAHERKKILQQSNRCAREGGQ
jgi:RNA polymerase sigma-70 factor (ECF subfamily)